MPDYGLWEGVNRGLQNVTTTFGNFAAFQEGARRERAIEDIRNKELALRTSAENRQEALTGANLKMINIQTTEAEKRIAQGKMPAIYGDQFFTPEFEQAAPETVKFLKETSGWDRAGDSQSSLWEKDAMGRIHMSGDNSRFALEQFQNPMVGIPFFRASATDMMNNITKTREALGQLQQEGNPQSMAQMQALQQKLMDYEKGYATSVQNMDALQRKMGGVSGQDINLTNRAPQTRKILREDQEINQQWDPITRDWVDIGSGPRFRPQRPTAPTTRKVIRGDKEIDQEWDTKTETWKDVGSGPRFRPEKPAKENKQILVSPDGKTQKAVDKNSETYDALVGAGWKPYKSVTGKLGPLRSRMPTEDKGKKLDEATARSILKEAGGDKEKARKLAKEKGYEF